MTQHHDHGAHHHEHGAVVHEPAADASEAYRRAYEAAQPDQGRRVISIELEARDTDWSFVPGSTVRAWGYIGKAVDGAHPGTPPDHRPARAQFGAYDQKGGTRCPL